jgi:2-dehydropantoate 2-reductase
VISHITQFAEMRCGRIDGRPDARLDAFAEAARAAGVDIVVSDAIEVELWQKFIFLVALSGATAATRHSLGPIRSDPDTRAFFINLMRETYAVGRARGVAVKPDYIDDRIVFADKSPPTFKSSLLHDLERGNRLELDWLAGKVVALGRELAIPTPANEAVYIALKLHRMGRG